jgi:hypothetical protein
MSMLAAAAGAADPDRAASLAPRRADLVDAAVDVQGRARVFGEALEGVPDHPSALALLLLEDGVAPAAAGEALWRAGAAAADAPAGPIARWYRLAAGASAALDADAGAAVARASEVVAVMPSDRLAKRALIRCAARAAPDRRAPTIVERTADGLHGACRRGRRPGWRWRWPRRWPRWTIRSRRRRFARSRAAASPRMRGGRSPISTRGRAAAGKGRGFRRDCWRGRPTRPRPPRAPR